MEVAIGIDTHKGNLAAAAVDALGRVLGVREFANDPKGHRSLVRWVKERGQPRTVGIEGSMHYGAAAASRLMAEGEDVREVSPSLTHVERRRRSKASRTPSTRWPSPEWWRQKRPCLRRDAQLSWPISSCWSTTMTNSFGQKPRWPTASTRTWVVMRPGSEKVVPNLRARRHVAKARSLVSRDRSVRGELVRQRLADMARLEAEIGETDRLIANKLLETSTTLTQIPGVGRFIAAKILGEVGEVSRIRSKASFALLSGTAPLLASSGQTHRHRLNRRGNPQLNWALHYLALVQSRTTPEAKAYLTRQREREKSHKEAMRCIKRHLSNVVYRHLVMDGRRLEQAA